MTILSKKKTPNNNKDTTLNQQQSAQQQVATSARPRLSRDDEPLIGASASVDSIENLNEENVPSSSSITTIDNLQSLAKITPSHSNYSKTKSDKNLPLNKSVRRTLDSLPVNNPSLDNDEPYNSEDEYEQTTTTTNNNAELNEDEVNFEKILKEKKGFIIKPVKNDGACLFRAIADQVFGDEEMHAIVRQNCMDYIVKNSDFFRAYITEDFDQYVARKRQLNCHGNHIEIIALSEIYNRPIEVYEYSAEPINVVHGMYQTDNDPIRVSYHWSIHYNSVIDPWRPTAGHGLGLPDLQPGRAQQSLITTALRESETSHIEQTMLDDKLAATDWEATQDELIQQIAKESYLQWLSETKRPSNDNNTASSSSESAAITSDTTEKNSSTDLLPLRLGERTDCEFNLPFKYDNNISSNLDLDDDDSLMQQVLAMSQFEYLEQWKQQQPEEESVKSEDITQPTTTSDANLS